MMSVDLEQFISTEIKFGMLFGLAKPSPNLIDTVESSRFSGAIGMVGCPGTRIGSNASRKTAKWLKADLEEIVNWEANGVLTLNEEHELTMLGVSNLPTVLAAHDIWWRHLPIMDMYIPEHAFEHAWQSEGERIRHLLIEGQRILIHCYAGLGRTGMIAARLLVEFGLHPEEAIAKVREANPARIQNEYQEDFVRDVRQLVY